ncbi:MAG TPA: NAD-dependent epimerase/dehydratase family protein [Bryobacteraceae bacterium]|nr:NAD-dependent epimerase/dehydratase family protein [Bryobacteraceae bacterium]
MPDRLLVTGGAGFVGSTVAFGLKRQYPQARVICLDNLRRRGSELNVQRLTAAGIEFLHGDVREPSDLASLAPDLIVECSAEPSAQAGYSSSPKYVVDTNLFGCYNCLELARVSKADFIFLSTSRVYPVQLLNELHHVESDTRFRWTDNQPIPGASSLGISEEFPTTGVRSIYGMTKFAAELMVEEFADAYGFRYVINRCGLIAGPWQMGKADQGVMTLWLAAHHFGRPLKYIGFNGEGKQVRDVLHVEDLTSLVVKQSGSMNAFDKQTLNVGGGLPFSLSLRETTAVCEELTGHRIPITSEEAGRKADIRVYLSDKRKIESSHGWKPERDPRTTLSDTLDWIKRNESQVADCLFN